MYILSVYTYIHIYVRIYIYSPVSPLDNAASCYPSGGGRVGDYGIDNRIVEVGGLVFVVNCNIPHRIHVYYIYLRLVDFFG